MIEKAIKKPLLPLEQSNPGRLIIAEEGILIEEAYLLQIRESSASGRQSE
jgi:hypothetical protein